MNEKPTDIGAITGSAVNWTRRSIMDQDFTVRRYEPSDAERVWTIHELALRASPLEFVEDAPADEDITEISDRYLDVGGEFLVGLTDDDVVATGGFQPQGDDKAELRRLRVHPEYQGHGYGDRLVAELERRAAEQGIGRLVLSTNERLRSARRLYEKRGYEETHREPHPPTGDEMIYYRKDI